MGGGAMLIAFEKKRSMVQSGSWACCLPERGRLGEEARLCRQRSRATPPHPANRARGARVRDGPGLDSGAVKATCQAVRATPSQGLRKAVRAATGLWAGPCRLAGSWGPAEPLAGAPAGSLSRGETHVVVHCSFINLMKLPNVETLIFWYQHQTISCFDVVLLMK